MRTITASQKYSDKPFYVWQVCQADCMCLINSE